MPVLHMFDEIEAAVASIRRSWSLRPTAGIILGTGLGGLTEEIEDAVTLDYEQIPHFPRSTSIGHAGRLVCGRLEGVPVVAMEGRFHAYEGYSMDRITFPVRVMKALGAELMIVSNACGGMNPQHRAGDTLVIEDHINLMGLNPLIGVNDDRLGPRFPDMSQPYDATLIDKALEIARRGDFVAHRGVYVAVTGPNLETGPSTATCTDRRRCGGHVDRARDDRGDMPVCVCWACRLSPTWFARRVEASRDRIDSGGGSQCRTEFTQDCARHLGLRGRRQVVAGFNSFRVAPVHSSVQARSARFGVAHFWISLRRNTRFHEPAAPAREA